MACPTCNDLGRIWVNEGRDLTFCPDCDFGVRQLFKVSRLQDKDFGLSLSSLEGDIRNIYTAALQHLYMSRSGMLTIWGGVGIGKTHAAKSFINYWIKTNKTRAQYWRMSELLAWIMEDYENRSAKLGIMAGIPLLVLDEIDKVQAYRSGDNSVDNQLDRAFGDLLSIRYDSNCVTLCISNSSPDEASPYIASRLKERCLEVRGIDYRTRS